MGTRRRRQPQWALSVLLALVLLGAGLRFYGLEIQSLRNDELGSWKKSAVPTLAEAIVQHATSPHPPLHRALLYFVERLFGTREFALRFPSAVIGVWGVALTYILGARIYSYREGLIAAGLTAILWAPLYYSQDGRGYAFLLAFSLLSTYFWIELLQQLERYGHPQWRTAAAYFLSASLCAYTEYYGVYLVLLQGLTAGLWLFRRAALKWAIALYVMLGAAYAPWVFTVRWDATVQRVGWIQPPSKTALASFLAFLFNNSLPLLALVLLLWTFLLWRGIAETRWQRRAIVVSPGFLLALWLVVPFAGVYAESLVAQPILAYRSLLISAPAAYLLLARAIVCLPFPGGMRTAITGILMALFLGQLLFGHGYYSRPHNEDFRGVVQYILDHDEQYRPSVIVASVWDKTYLHYYFDRQGSDRTVDLVAGRAEDIPSVRALIKDRKPTYVWFGWGNREPEPEFVQFLSNELELIEDKQLTGAGVSLYSVSVE